MICPKCSTETEPTTDQHVAGAGATLSGLFVANAGIFGMIAAPYLLPVIVGGALWSTCRLVTCSPCGHRFNFFQSGSN
jgi:hypothetical protein